MHKKLYHESMKILTKLGNMHQKRDEKSKQHKTLQRLKITQTNQ